MSGLRVDEAARCAAEAAFAHHYALSQAPAMAWGVVSGGELTWSGGWEANQETVFRIASMTKSFTAAAVLALRDDGVLELDRPATEYAPELAHILLPTADAPRITLRHLLSMSAGFASDDPWADRNLHLTPDAFDAHFRAGVTFSYPPGTEFEYSNFGFGVIGRIVERASGRRLQAVVSERLLAPLGMATTAWQIADLPADAVVATGFNRRDGVEELIVEPSLPDGEIAPMGGIFTTVSDLAKWVAFLADGFPPRDAADAGPLSRSSRRELQQVARVTAPSVSTTCDGRTRRPGIGYGFGVGIEHHPDLGWISHHGGGFPGFGSHMRWVQQTGVGFIALANITYARMGDATNAALETLAAQDALSASPIPPTPQIEAAARSLAELFAHWDDALADAVFADNVYADHPRELRRAETDRLRADHGALSLLRVEPEHAAFATAVLRGDSTLVRIEFMLSPHVPPRIQWYEVQ